MENSRKMLGKSFHKKIQDLSQSCTYVWVGKTRTACADSKTAVKYLCAWVNKVKIGQNNQVKISESLRKLRKLKIIFET